MMAAMVIGLGISIVGTIMQVQAAQKQADAQKQALELQQKEEFTRETAARLDAQRKQRELVRQSIIARSNALSAGTNQGAQYGSALPGAYGQIGAQTAYNYAGVSQQLDLSRDVFSTNRQIFGVRKEEAQAGADAALGSGISSLGGAIGKSLGGIGKLG